ncbi:hypothetical protein T11_16016 [Trichinella zimbabwensis]|uniref:Uncharacterized protein n=1 Tax=Trichinella zimbabwensis TaxID=268475 RepID=A0A0V1HQM3_9BILA|nr:hypothetical protein T11_16016 [Trichinella zimbabwensis]
MLINAGYTPGRGSVRGCSPYRIKWGPSTTVAGTFGPDDRWQSTISKPASQGSLAKMLMSLAFLRFFLFPDYEYNQFLSQAGRPAEAQLVKSGRSNLAPRCLESCLEWPASRLFRNHKQISPNQGKQLLVPGWDNLKRPIPAPAVTLSQQPHTSLGGKN